LCHQPRDGLESLIVDIEAMGLTQAEFLGRYVEAVTEETREHDR
jgi:hypothetical protein